MLFLVIKKAQKMKIILLLSLFFFPIALQAQIGISTDGTTWMETGSVRSYDTPKIYAEARYTTLTGQVLIRLAITSAATNIIQDDFYISTTKTVLDTYTGTGTGDTAKYQSAVLQYVVDYLEGISENSGITFTIF